jgi:hypothetical protein
MRSIFNLVIRLVFLLSRKLRVLLGLHYLVISFYHGCEEYSSVFECDLEEVIMEFVMELGDVL